MNTHPKKVTIIGLTTDPYENIYGYSLVFFRLFNFLQIKNEDVDIFLLSNDGVSSTIVKNSNFKTIPLRKKHNAVLKTITLVYMFVYLVFQYDKNTIIIANCEVPELIAAFILKIKFHRVYGVIQDDRVRDSSFSTRFVCRFRILLLYAIKNVIFTNRYTMTRFSNSVHKYYIGNPIFY